MRDGTRSGAYRSALIAATLWFLRRGSLAAGTAIGRFRHRRAACLDSRGVSIQRSRCTRQSPVSIGLSVLE